MGRNVVSVPDPKNNFNTYLLLYRSSAAECGEYNVRHIITRVDHNAVVIKYEVVRMRITCNY